MQLMNTYVCVYIYIYIYICLYIHRLVLNSGYWSIIRFIFPKSFKPFNDRIIFSVDFSKHDFRLQTHRHGAHGKKISRSSCYFKIKKVLWKRTCESSLIVIKKLTDSWLRFELLYGISNFFLLLFSFSSLLHSVQNSVRLAKVSILK